jgi:hypothetical protein
LADRSVSISVRARVGEFIAGMGKAKESTQDLGRQMTQTGAYADQFRRRLEAATKALPQIKIDADSSAAEIKFAQIRAEMEKLASKRIGIDIDAASAQAQLAELQRELEQLQGQSATVDVKADIGAALAELRTVDAEVSRLAGRSARVDVNADVGGALASIGLVAAALASLPAVTSVAVGVTALGGAFAAAGVGAASFAAVAVPSLGRINDALKAQESAAKSAGSATGGAGQTAAQAAQQALQLEMAEKRLKDAQDERKRAQEDLTRATEAGRRALEDMNFSLERSILSQKDAQLAVREAEARLAELKARGDASDLDIERAMLNVEMAHQRAREQEVKTQRAKQDTVAANKAGVKGTKEYQQGLDRLKDAEEAVAQAAAQLKVAQLQAQSAMSGGGGAASALKDAFADLSKEERILAKDIKAFTDQYVAWQRSIQPDVFPAIHQGLDLMRLGLREAGPLARSAGTAFLDLGKDAEKALRGPFWQEFLFDLNTNIPGAITSMGAIGINTFTGFAGVIKALLPYGMELLENIEGLSKQFADWGTNLENNQAFHEFLADVKENAPEVWELIKNVGQALLNIGEAIAPLSVGAFSGLGALAEIVAGMDPDRIQTIALAIGAIKLASMGLGAVSAWQNLAGGITAVGGAAGKTTGKMAALGKAAIGVSAAVIGFELTGSAISSLAGQSAGIDKLTLSLTELGQSGRWAGDLQSQWTTAFGDANNAAKAFGEGLRELQDPSFGEMFWLHPITELTAILPGLDSDVDILEQKFTDLDNALAGMVTSGNAEMARNAFEQLAKQAEAQGIPVAKLSELLPTYSQAVRVAGTASAEASAGVDQAKQRMDGFNQSLSTFSGRTDALQALQNLKGAYKDAEQAIAAANGKLQVHATMTDAQKNAVIQAREAFITYIGKVQQSADAQATLSGRTTDARDAVLRQLPAMLELAGKNSEAREQVLALARAYGISESDAKKAAKGGQDLLEVLAKLKSKDIRVGVDTRPAEEGLESFIKRYSNRSLAIAIHSKVKAAGGISDARGVELMAAGGLRPMIQSQATLVPGGGARPSTIFAEAGKEAYIPYDPAYRGRALAILQQVASDFGLEVFSAQAAKKVDSLSGGLKEAQYDVSSGLSSATSMLSQTMGQAGSLTSSISNVGMVGEQLGQVWSAGSATVSDSLIGVSDQVGISTDMVVMSTEKVGEAALTVAEVLDKAMAAIAAKTGGTKTSSTSSATTAKGAAASSAVKMASKALQMVGGKTQTVDENMIAGHYGSSGFVSTHGGGLSNSSRVSAPQQLRPVSAAAAPAGGEAVSSTAGGVSGRGGNAPVVVQGDLVVKDRGDADYMAERLWFKQTSRG